MNKKDYWAFVSWLVLVSVFCLILLLRTNKLHRNQLVIKDAHNNGLLLVIEEEVVGEGNKETPQEIIPGETFYSVVDGRIVTYEEKGMEHWKPESEVE